MYHLQNKLYVQIDSRISRDDPYVSIGPNVGWNHVPSETESPAEQLGYASSLDDLDVDSFSELLTNAFDQEDKTYIFVDGKSYLRIYAMVVKSLMPGVTYDVFRRIFLCKKATFCVSLLNMHKPATDILQDVTINDVVVKELFEFEDPLKEAVLNLLAINPDSLSLEWRMMRLFTDNRIGKLPKTMRNILRRIALANTYDALDVWGRMIANPDSWEFAGADIDTLMNGQSIFEGTLNFRYLNNPMFLQPNLFKNEPTKHWILGLLDELILVLEHCDEAPTAGRTRLVRQLMTEDADLSDPEVVKARIMIMFNGPKRLALPNADSGKYDENLIRYILTEDVAVLRKCVEGAIW
jgi:hypothetical protein